MWKVTLMLLSRKQDMTAGCDVGCDYVLTGLRCISSYQDFAIA